MGLPTDPSLQPDAAGEYPYPSDIALPPSRSTTFDALTDSPAHPPTDEESQQQLATRHRPKRSVDERNGRSTEDSQTSPQRDRSRPNGKQSTRICGKCGGHLTGQFVRALGDTYHLECFTCHVRSPFFSSLVISPLADPTPQDCGKVVASKFFPVPELGGVPPCPPAPTRPFESRLGELIRGR